MKMALYWGSASPYVRKVMIVAHELGCVDEIELLDSAAHPVARDARIKSFNPLAKVPAARADDGTMLYDSRVIAEFIDAKAEGALFPAPGPARWTALRRQALADGMLDAALLVRYENIVRPEAHQWPLWVEQQLAKINDALDDMDADIPAVDCTDIGAISYACALGWLSFRFPDLDWGAARPALSRWHEVIETRPAMVATKPTA